MLLQLPRHNHRGFSQFTRHTGLNTCVGSHNYKDFFRTMCFIFAMEVSHFVIHVALLIVSFTNNSDIAEDWLAADLPILVYVVLFVFVLFNLVSILLIGQLLHFHVGLQRDGITTYQYIVRDHKKKRERLRLEDELRSQREQKVATARQQGKSLTVMQLRIGNECRAAGCAACDPLTLPEPNPEPDPEAGFAAALGTGAKQEFGEKSDDDNNAEETVDDVDQADSTGATMEHEQINSWNEESNQKLGDHFNSDVNSVSVSDQDNQGASSQGRTPFSDDKLIEQ